MTTDDSQGGRTWIARAPRIGDPDATQRLTWGVGLLLFSLAIAITLLGRPLVGVALILATVLAMLFVLTDRDATTILTVFVVVLFLIPARFHIGPLGGIGAPARLVGIAAAVWWLASRFNRSIGGDHGQQPLRVSILVFTWWLLLTYGFAQLREMDPIESGAADRRVIVAVAMAGIALLAMDGIPNRARLEVLLRRIVALGGVVALLGILQFFGIDLVSQLRFPGLTLTSELRAVTSYRGGLPRVNSTAVHAIEFGIVMALLVPFAIHFALYGRERRWTAWLWTAAMIFAIPLTVSRSSIVAIAIGLPVLMIAWSWRRRLIVLTALAAGLTWLATSSGALLETILGLFQRPEENFSIQARVSDYEAIYAYFRESPIVGRGAGTFEPSVYFFLDNEWLMTLVTTGIVGILLLGALFLVAVSCMRGVAKRVTDEATRHLAQAYISTMAMFVIAFGVFDAFGFAMNAGLFYLVIGTAGALWRIEVGYSYRMRDESGRLLSRQLNGTSAGQMLRSGTGSVS